MNVPRQTIDVKALADQVHNEHVAGRARPAGPLKPRKFRHRSPRTSLIAEAAKRKLKEGR